jgi:uncharacterized protein (DUF302 family)
MRNMRISDASQVLTKTSLYSVAETLARFSELLAAKGVRVYAIINHSDAAHEVGLDLPETHVIIFGEPEAGTPVMEQAPLMALDLPLKVLIWDDDGRTRVSYPVPEALAERHGLSSELTDTLKRIEPFTDAVILHDAHTSKGTLAS